MVISNILFFALTDKNYRILIKHNFYAVLRVIILDRVSNWFTVELKCNVKWNSSFAEGNLGAACD